MMCYDFFGKLVFALCHEVNILRECKTDLVHKIVQPTEYMAGDQYPPIRSSTRRPMKDKGWAETRTLAAFNANYSFMLQLATALSND